MCAEDRCLDGVADSEAECDFADTVVLRFAPSGIDNVCDVSSSSAAKTEETSMCSLCMFLYTLKLHCVLFSEVFVYST